MRRVPKRGKKRKVKKRKEKTVVGVEIREQKDGFQNF